MALNEADVIARMEVICPEASSVSEEALEIYVKDAIEEVESTFTNDLDTGVTDTIKEKAGAYLAAHFCAVNLFQQSQTVDRGGVAPPTTNISGTTITPSGSTGGVKLMKFRDKSVEYFAGKSSEGGSIISKYKGVGLHQLALSTTSYGVEYIRLSSLYSPTDPFLIGNGDY